MMGNEPGNLNRFHSLGLLYSLVYLIRLVLGGDDVSASAVLYSADEFARQLPTKPHLVLFYAPWCGHCKRLMPVYDTLAEKYNGELKKERVVIAKVDCTVETALCSNNDVTGYPTLLFYWSEPNVYVRFKGRRDLPGLEEFIEKLLLDGPPKEERETEPSPAPRESLYELTDANFASHIAVGHHFVKFFAPWCGHCRHLAPTWEELARLFDDDDSVTIAKVDCTKFGNICTQHSVRGYPTLIFFSQGKQVTTYHGARNINDLQEFVQRTKSDQDKLEKMAADEFVPDQATEEEEKKPADDSLASEGKTIELTDETFAGHISEGNHFVKFYAPWCGHCRNLAPIWEELAKTFHDSSSVSVVKVDCTKYTTVCKQYSIRGYPSLFFFRNGEKVSEYQGARTLDSLKDFVKKTLSPPDAVEATDGTDESDSKKVMAIELTDATFDSHIAAGHHFIKFFAPWCGHCKKLAPTWDELSMAFQDDSSISIAKVDCTKFGSVCSQYSVRGYPSLLFFSKGKQVAKYQGPRTLDALKAFAEQTKADEDDKDDTKETEETKAAVVTLNEKTFEAQLQKGHTFVNFVQQGCTACESLEPVWLELGKKFQSEPKVVVAKVDCSVEEQLCRQNTIDSFPAFVLYYKGDRLAEYKGPLDLNSFHAFVLQGMLNPQSLPSSRDEL